MGRPANTEVVLAAIRKSSGLDDDELAQRTGIRPRQQINQICRRLADRGFIERRLGPRGKVVNVPAAAALAPTSTIPPAKQRQPVRPPQEAGIRPPHSFRSAFPGVGTLDSTLLILPCSGAKAAIRERASGPSIVNCLPENLAGDLRKARQDVRVRAAIDESTLVPAWRRYTGRLYQEAGAALDSAVARGLHILILSGGYGVVLAAEPIGTYEARFAASWWTRGLIQQLLGTYAQRNGLRQAVALVSATTSYRQVVATTPWHRYGVEEARILSPEPVRGGALVKAPRALGEAFADLLAGRLSASWRSSDGLRLDSVALT